MSHSCFKFTCFFSTSFAVSPFFTCCSLEQSDDVTLASKFITADMDECERGQFSCEKNSYCVNAEGSYDCKCKSGFQTTDKFCKGTG